MSSEPGWGRRLVFVGSVGGGQAASDGPNPERMIADFGLPTVHAVDRICGIVGVSAANSLSPSLHNAAYRALGYPGLFLPFRVDSFAEFWSELVESQAWEQIGMSIQGLTVASPNKESAAALATFRSRTAAGAASANLVFRRGPAWVAATTDPTGRACQRPSAVDPGATSRRRRLRGLWTGDCLGSEPGGGIRDAR